jgi:hypothetical protein
MTILLQAPELTCGLVSHTDEVSDGSKLAEVGAEILVLHVVLLTQITNSAGKILPLPDATGGGDMKKGQKGENVEEKGRKRNDQWKMLNIRAKKQ